MNFEMTKKKPFLCLASLFALPLILRAEENSFRVTPYVQRPATDAMTVMWLASTNSPASIRWWEEGTSDFREIASAVEIPHTSGSEGRRFGKDGVIEYSIAPELGYGNSPEASDNIPNRFGAWEMAFTTPWQYRVRLTGLKPDTRYRYRVLLDGAATYEDSFRTAPLKWREVKFTLYADSETEPADNDPSTGRTDDWTDPSTGQNRKYYATQTEAYASNICAIAEFNPDLMLIAGDIAQKGSRQCDWDEFWRHNAGKLNNPAGSRPILASPGNHDYWSYADEGLAAMRKYLSYFEFEPNGTEADADQQERFHKLEYGPVTFLFTDANNGDDADPARDTHLFFKEATCRAPNFNPGSVQYRWLEKELASAQKRGLFTFVVSHQCPYSVGYHGRPSGHKSPEEDWISGRPLRILNDLFLKYGVDGWLCGHDEMMERSTVCGEEILPDGTKRPHTMHIWDMGIGGDGLRGNHFVENPNEAFRAGKDSKEIRDERGTLIDGGTHYGHLQVTVSPQEDGTWKAVFDPVYILFTTNETGRSLCLGLRNYDDKVTITARPLEWPEIPAAGGEPTPGKGK